MVVEIHKCPVLILVANNRKEYCENCVLRDVSYLMTGWYPLRERHEIYAAALRMLEDEL